MQGLYLLDGMSFFSNKITVKFEVNKPRTWKGLSYILKSSILQNEITARGLDCNVHLIYRTPQGDNQTDWLLFEAEYWMPNQHVDHCRFYIRTGVVPTSQRKKVVDILNNEVLPKLVDWMEIQICKPQNSTDRGGFYAYVKKMELILNY